VLCLVSLSLGHAHAAEPEPVLVFTNRSSFPVRAEVQTPKPSRFPLKLEPGELASIPYRAGATITPSDPGQPPQALMADTVYVFGDGPLVPGGAQTWVCRPVALAVPRNWQLVPRQRQALLPAQLPADPKQKNVLKVVLAVDDDELTAKAVWEKRYRQRLAAASQVLEYHTGLQIEVVAQTTWVSSNRITDFDQSLAEFERSVRPEGPADLVIGFTSQYELLRGRIHLGGTRGLFASHILIRERSKKMSEVEKLEILVHEIGHYLGANHSGDGNSVMRPMLADRQAVERRFRIFYDPLNALAVNLIAAEYRANQVRRPEELSDATRIKLLAIYAEQARMMPEDSTSKSLLDAIGAVPRK
jgi:hypothetical protein